MILCVFDNLEMLEYYNYQGELWYITIYKLICRGVVAGSICTYGVKLIRWMDKYSPVRPMKLIYCIYIILIGIVYQTAEQMMNKYIVDAFYQSGNGDLLSSIFLLVNNNLVKILPILSFAVSINLWKKLNDSLMNSFAYLENKLSMNLKEFN